MFLNLKTRVFISPCEICAVWNQKTPNLICIISKILTIEFEWHQFLELPNNMGKGIPVDLDFWIFAPLTWDAWRKKITLARFFTFSKWCWWLREGTGAPLSAAAESFSWPEREKIRKCFANLESTFPLTWRTTLSRNNSANTHDQKVFAYVSPNNFSSQGPAGPE